MRELSNHLWAYAGLVESVLLLSFIFYGLERVIPAEQEQPVSKWLFNLIYFHFLLVLLLCLQFLFGPIYTYFATLAGGGLLPRVIDQPRSFTGQLLFALTFAFVWDVWQYWIHRLQHTYAFLWETHKFHHSETSLNSSAQARHHLLNYILSLTLYLPILLFFGSLAPHFIAAFLMFRLWGFVNHANIRLDLGRLTPFISGPQWHRIHHSANTKHHDKNFAAFFPFIDILFGTYYHPQKNEYPPTGLTTQAREGYLREATIAPFLSLHKITLTKARTISRRTRYSPFLTWLKR